MKVAIKQNNKKETSILYVGILGVILSLTFLLVAYFFPPFITCLGAQYTYFDGMFLSNLSLTVTISLLIICIISYLLLKSIKLTIYVAIIALLIVAGLYLMESFVLQSCPGSTSFVITNAQYVTGSPIFSGSSGDLYVTIGQATGTDWISTNLIFVPAVASTHNPAVLFSPANIFSIKGGLPNFQTANINMSVANVASIKVPIPIGAAIPGSIWAQYQTRSNGPFNYTQIATATLRAS